MSSPFSHCTLNLGWLKRQLAAGLGFGYSLIML
jgi:hypothetical protein